MSYLQKVINVISKFNSDTVPMPLRSIGMPMQRQPTWPAPFGQLAATIKAQEFADIAAGA